MERLILKARRIGTDRINLEAAVSYKKENPDKKVIIVGVDATNEVDEKGNLTEIKLDNSKGQKLYLDFYKWQAYNEWKNIMEGRALRLW